MKQNEIRCPDCEITGNCTIEEIDEADVIWFGCTCGYYGTIKSKIKNGGEARSPEGTEQDHLLAAVAGAREKLANKLPFGSLEAIELQDLLDEQYEIMSDILQRRNVGNGS
jgi:hypothetical protein